MKAFLAEYSVCNDPELAPEGAAMLSVLSRSFTRCGYDVVTPEGPDFEGEIRRLAPGCDVGLVIAPDHLIFRYTHLLEQLTHNIGCGSMNAAVCANKLRTAAILARHGIEVPPPAPPGGMQVVKPIMGCGSLGVRLTDEEPGADEFAQGYLEGETLSVSLVGSRVTGNVCEYYSGAPPLLLAVNRQEMGIDRDGNFRYLGGETPIHPDREEEIVSTAIHAMSVLGCQGYTGIDIIAGDRIYVVDVNPRPTTSLVGIAEVMEEEIADILVAASRGEAPAEVHLSGRVRFDKDGGISRI
ncbi:MAG TPA: ATP-grasp domain-containing protein [Candidatus Methanoculleus thermohydrogenotrophicum]|jgi:predicted ATP-grasp superfamily ATP-dependent carboligase|nr:ATP-grasp domain-containing protein [Candidatus Methanoculleus thermohydrogenotrophicum]NLM82863.1 ATP-grasp domain-containing protein [Candidatus Methanoculleus thermohydrogenotrophicum]HOB17914.1 ATP-grasp domain-containing protein [Candidatus Methanoculleus thermohydrogenotrophicum]HPZ38049.1 ATP-grasp domain-containing protein [Candidatus Methanoculleus thermohydrogenotrophicum]HQC91301.1 ATP-grasp domain-containing protein [Candidatus Methanoculleus thermohydrogenotrophicum]